MNITSPEPSEAAHNSLSLDAESFSLLLASQRAFFSLTASETQELSRLLSLLSSDDRSLVIAVLSGQMERS